MGRTGVWSEVVDLRSWYYLNPRWQRLEKHFELADQPTDVKVDTETEWTPVDEAATSQTQNSGSGSR